MQSTEQNPKKMTQAQIIKLIRKSTTDLLVQISPASKVKAKIKDQDNQEVIWVEIESKEDPNLLIGKLGANLAALQHLLRLIVRRKLNEGVNFIVDVNQYKENRLDYLEKLAQASAATVIKTQKPKILEAMSAYERRVIHLALADNGAVATESDGEGEKRRVIIKIKSE